MPDQAIQFTKELTDIFMWVIGAALGFLGFNIKRTAVKVDEHDRNHISREEFNETVGVIRKENREDFKDLNQKIDRLLDK